MLEKGKVPRSLRDDMDYFLVAYYFGWVPTDLDSIPGDKATNILFILDVLKDKLGMHF